MMRITQNMLNNNMLYYLGNSWQRMERLQEMLSTGKKISKPSHDPIVASRGMLFRTNFSEIEQFRSNTDEAMSWLTQTESAVGEGIDILLRVKELLTQAANDTNGREERQKIATEIRQLRDQLGSVANTTFADKYIFNGTHTLTPPYDKTAEDLISDVNNSEIPLEVSTNVKIPINVQPDELFKTGGSTVFAVLKNVISHLDPSPTDPPPTTADIQNDLEIIQSHIDNFLKVRASVGARMNRVELLQNRLGNQSFGTEKMISDGEDADLAKVIIDLQTNENVHRAALAAGSRLIQPSLLDFLR
ncbi:MULTISPECIES: flagellar hook-associated protein FlgL [Aneurinibacillus]|jgi:flagellar hook-associated protein 3 FlgL|uniref:Flagellar hook-associated protein FlgL n=2 Tax=Aneurinibacillus thermoaerophilus TaxID=143495 RepID=A0ABX8YA07_ANETH|nr:MULTISPECIES: flagellar hook-associated protein FlgL [Aneurinibacillus]MED0681388.1 flagellar hook-associated protein FlgL [Aneurinibacillus thermoaerophilus]MED0738653.1 flagellar hook-associated protein FlgL [Aneurinibacillus thermoaerophilus]MED0757770.1 flagellar hook-associated protein FlgL [Aneurinibacillus thermoaerophilus]MED0761546.1 flagellar hook-associated protein FlgL [Aneurinibacillus thermoaerophilus]MED0763310.1 flagellar hook-associated protein FlgL [Aneurinibacillus thermo